MSEQVIEILARVLDIEESNLNEESSMDNVDEWDSMNHLGIVMEIEKAFAIRFSPPEMAQLSSVKAIVEKVSSKTQEKTA